jgi:TPR repeat protein
LLAALTATGRGTRADPALAVSLLLPLANAGDAEAAYLLANLYAGQPELAAQRGEAMKYAQAAAISGKAEAMLTVANLYAQGIGVDGDESKAQEWLRKAEQTGRIRIDIRH